MKKDTLAQVLSCEFCKIVKKTFLTEHLRTTASEGINTISTASYHQDNLQDLFIYIKRTKFEKCVSFGPSTLGK